MALEPHVCGGDIRVAEFNKQMKPMIKLFLNKAGESNFRQQERCVEAIFKVCRHPHGDIGVVIEEIMKLVIDQNIDKIHSTQIEVRLKIMK